jgi:hypothetical protein
MARNESDRIRTQNKLDKIRAVNSWQIKSTHINRIFSARSSNQGLNPRGCLRYEKKREKKCILAAVHSQMWDLCLVTTSSESELWDLCLVTTSSESELWDLCLVTISSESELWDLCLVTISSESERMPQASSLLNKNNFAINFWPLSYASNFDP